MRSTVSVAMRRCASTAASRPSRIASPSEGAYFVGNAGSPRTGRGARPPGAAGAGGCAEAPRLLDDGRRRPPADDGRLDAALAFLEPRGGRRRVLAELLQVALLELVG